MQTLFKNKLMIGLVLVLIVGGFIYRSFSGSVITTGDSSALVIGQDLVELSDKLSRVTLSSELFTTPGYTLLTDFTAPLPQQSFGRKNPFDVIGRE